MRGVTEGLAVGSIPGGLQQRCPGHSQGLPEWSPDLLASVSNVLWPFTSGGKSGFGLPPRERLESFYNCVKSQGKNPSLVLRALLPAPTHFIDCLTEKWDP